MADSEVSALTESTAPADDDIVYLTNAGGTIDRKVKVSTLRLVKSVVKSSDESVTSSTTLQDDNELLAAMLANTDYSFEAWLSVEESVGAGAANIKIAFTVPAAATILALVTELVVGSSPTVTGLITASGGTVTVVLTETANDEFIHVIGSVRNGANLGNLTLQWAQNTSSSTTVTVEAGSWLKLTREG